MIIEIPESFTTYVDAALVRLRGQFPGVEFRRCAEGIAAEPREGDVADRLQSAIMHSVYRERIYVETLSMREALIGAVMK